MYIEAEFWVVDDSGLHRTGIRPFEGLSDVFEVVYQESEEDAKGNVTWKTVNSIPGIHVTELVAIAKGAAALAQVLE